MAQEDDRTTRFYAPSPDVSGAKSYEGVVRATLLRFGSPNPDGDLAQTKDYWKHCQAAGIAPEVCGALIYETVRHRHSGTVTLNESTGAAEAAGRTTSGNFRHREEAGRRRVTREQFDEVLREHTEGLVEVPERVLFNTYGIRPLGGKMLAASTDGRILYEFDGLGYAVGTNYGTRQSTMTYHVYPSAIYGRSDVMGSAEPGAAAPTGEEWEVVVKRGAHTHLGKLVDVADRRPDEITAHAVTFRHFHDDEKAQRFARRLTSGGFITTYGARRALAAETGAAEKTAYRWVDISFADLADAERFSKLVEKQSSSIGAFAGGTKHGATVTTNASRSVIDKTLKKHRWHGGYSVPAAAEECSEGDPGAMPAVVAVAAVAPPSGGPSASGAAEPMEVVMEPPAAAPTPGIPWVKVTRDPARYEACVKTADKIGPIKDARAVYALLGPALNEEDQEVFVVVLLNLRGELRGVCEVARGQRSRVTVGPADVLRPVIAGGAEGFVVVHNHPTGKASPSKADRDLTKLIADATAPYGKDVCFIDHVVIGLHQAYSICEGKMYRIGS